MPYREFEIMKLEAKTKLRTHVQHKLREVLRCYTVFNFKMEENAKTYSFMKSYKINGIKRNDDKLMTGRYELEDVDRVYCKLKLWVD